MPKSSRILSLLNFLTRKDHVTLAEIISVCGVPERTAYRYLDSLSEAGVPIYYDRKSKAYRLANPVSLLSRTLTDTDVVVLVASLLLMKSHLNPQYRSMVESIASKVCSSKTINLHDIEAGIENELQDSVNSPDYSTQITMAIIFQAVHDRRPLTISRRTDAGRIELHSIKNPGITFEKGWQLRGEGNFGTEQIEMESILTASTNLHGTDRHSRQLT